MLNRRLVLQLSAGLGLFPYSRAFAQGRFPTHNVRIIVPFAAGGPTDVIARIIADAMSAKWSKPVIVENRPGGGTLLGTDVVAKAEPDGHTIGIVITAHVINPAVRKRMPFDALTDLRGVTQIADAHMVVVANPQFDAADVAGLIKLARSASDPIAYASPGVATGTHMAAELLQKAAGIKLLHVPYNGSAPALTDVIAGRVPLMFDVWHSVQQHVNEKTLKVIGVINSTRIPNAPQYPCIGETVPSYEASSMFGIVVSAKAPDAAVNQLNLDLSEFIRSPLFAEKAKAFGMNPVGSTAKEYDQVISAEIAKWKVIASDANIRID